ncbi:oocyte zinc finger protein XlCOF28-like isoform X2 [Betta splendens]|uniref:Oocyte zinc finger protein XlCOF28-like isoform X2 n=1 Tax=Betta splendens TaxID=158456 RepID=A0A6P7NT65_BETSP|nr:oocyte zinc finger protein XlCOF28-like isoform X2 [Betta splendens]
MSDYLKRAFRAQLTTTMDSLMRRVVFEIMTVFENSIHDHQMELAHKGEEVVQLKIKLQTAELKLKERECVRDGAVEMDKAYVNETQRLSEAIQNTPDQTSDVPEIDVEVPDDWCAPLGCETVTKKNEDECPSVDTPDTDFHQEMMGPRRSERASPSNKKHNNTQHQSLTLCKKKAQIQYVRTDKRFLQEVKAQYSDGLGLRRGRIFTGNEQEKIGKTKREKRKIADIKLTKLETEKQDDDKMYNCRFCKKVFDTEFGLTVHVRSHKTCTGCKKEFPFPSSLKAHKLFCKRFKKLLVKRGQHANAQESDSHEEKNASLSNSIKQESTDSSNSVQNDAFSKMHSCTYYKKKVTMRHKLKKPMSHHTVEKHFKCSRCPRKFHVMKALQIHMTRMHKDQQRNPSETNKDPAWTKPSEDTEMKNGSSQAGYNKAVSVCQKKHPHVVKKKHMSHTLEKHFKCSRCPRKFHVMKALQIHMTRMHKDQQLNPSETNGDQSWTKPLEDTEIKRDPSQANDSNPVSDCQKKFPLVCEDCGKGFFYQGRLANHMQRVHM